MKVLYIEDDPTSERLVGMFLRVAGFQLLTAPDALRGLKVAYREKPDVILLDYQLPGINGGQAVTLLRTTDRLKGTPVVAVTAGGSANDYTQFSAAGFDGFVPKPIDRHRLVAEIERVVGMKKRAASTRE